MIDLAAMAKRRARGLTADQKQKISLGRGLVRNDVNAHPLRRAADGHRSAYEVLLRSQLKRLHRQFASQWSMSRTIRPKP